METERIDEIIRHLLQEIEEEDIGISLMTTHYQDENELAFFDPAGRARVVAILKQVTEDSRRHKQVIERIVGILEKTRDEK